MTEDSRRLDPVAFGVAVAVVWTAYVVAVWIGASYTGMWQETAALLSDVYAGVFDLTATGLVAGGFVSLVDSFVAGAVVALIYNFVARKLG